MPPSQTTTHFYVIAKKDTQALVTSVMAISDHDREDAVLAFTSAAAAQLYLTQAGWVTTDTVAELDTESFHCWLKECQLQNQKWVAFNPDRVRHMDGICQQVFDIDSLLQQLDQTDNTPATILKLVTA